jgi:Cu2+-containing amine oxidase
VINLTEGRVIYNHELDQLLHGPGDVGEVVDIEELVHKDEKFQAEVRRLGLDPSLVICEPWIYGKYTRWAIDHLGTET